MKKLLSILLTSVLAIGALTGCGSKTEAPADAAAETDTAQADGEKVYRTLDEIKESGTVKIGVFSDKNPFGYVDENGNFVETGKRCYQLWGRDECCENCSSKRALEERDWMSKLEIGDNGIFAVLSRQVALNGRELVMEILFPMDENLRAAKTALPSKANFMLMNFYRDSLTRAYSRVYLEDFLPNLQHSLHLHPSSAARTTAPVSPQPSVLVLFFYPYFLIGLTGYFQ